MDTKRNRQSDGGLGLRVATLADGLFVLWLEEVCMKEYAIALWGEWRKSQALEKFDPSYHQIIEMENRAVGCIAITSFEDFLRVDKLYISPDHRKANLSKGF